MKVIAQGILVTKIPITIQKIDFLPQISKFLGQNCTFLSLVANRSCTGQCFQHERGVLLVPCYYEGTPPKKKISAQKRTNLAQNCFFSSPNTDILGPFDPMPDQNTIQTRCLGCFPLCGNQNVYFLP